MGDVRVCVYCDYEVIAGLSLLPVWTGQVTESTQAQCLHFEMVIIV